MRIFLTNIPSFYKIRLYNEISKKTNILVVFTGISREERKKDFFSENYDFRYISLNGSLVKKIVSFFFLLRKMEYDEILIGGWENIICLIAPFMSNKEKNSCFVESSVYESQVNGVKGWVKKMYFHRIRKVYASGILQEQLVKKLGYNGNIVFTGGCGLLNYVEQPVYTEKAIVREFIYVGRLAEEKNLELLINAFNKLPDLHLSIVGYGYLENKLKSLASSNVSFIGAVENKSLSKYYSNADVLVLPSKSEPWGLVVEEALNHGLPVIISNRVGCRKTLVTDLLGLVFNFNNIDDLISNIVKITDVDFYNTLRKNVCALDFKDRAKKQVESYL